MLVAVSVAVDDFEAISFTRSEAVRRRISVNVDGTAARSSLAQPLADTKIVRNLVFVPENCQRN
jgi:hypothetical protein